MNAAKAPTLAVAAGRLKRRNHGNGHSYYLDGEKLDGVTTLLNGLPKPALVNWAANAAAEDADEHWAEYTQLSSYERKQAISSAHRRSRDLAANKGTAVHQLADALSRHQEVVVPPFLTGHVDAAVKFLDEWQVEVIEAEVSGYNQEHFYGGTFDLLFRSPLYPGRVFLADYKTSRTGIYGETAMQLEAYSRFDAITTEGGSETPLVEYGITDHLAIWVRSDGYSVFPMESGDEVFDTFLNAAAIARAQKGERYESRIDQMKGREVFVGMDF